jgi:hypothetical protein
MGPFNPRFARHRPSLRIGYLTIKVKPTAKRLFAHLFLCDIANRKMARRSAQAMATVKYRRDYWPPVTGQH